MSTSVYIPRGQEQDVGCLPGLHGVIECSMSEHLTRTLVLIAILLISACCLSSCWYTKQAAHFLSERARSVPVSRLVSDSDTSTELAAFLSRVYQIRQYALDEVGLSPTRNYTRYVTVDKDYLADVVSACASDSFTRHYWKYPILGSMPYKGFYDKADAIKEVARLKEAGLDVIVRPVEAFSSLGYFTDPLYSFMLRYEEDALAELIIHESAHATLFIKGADQFNEEFATFVGRTGTRGYLESRHGKDSQQIQERIARRSDNLKFVAFLQETAGLLEEAYEQESSREEKQKVKATIIAARATVYASKAGDLFTNKAYERFDMGSINNAYIDMYRLYEENLELYEAWYIDVAGGSLPVFVTTLKALATESGKTIKASMAKRLEQIAIKK